MLKICKTQFSSFLKFYLKNVFPFKSSRNFNINLLINNKRSTNFYKIKKTSKFKSKFWKKNYNRLNLNLKKDKLNLRKFSYHNLYKKFFITKNHRKLKSPRNNTILFKLQTDIILKKILYYQIKRSGFRYLIYLLHQASYLLLRK